MGSSYLSIHFRNLDRDQAREAMASFYERQGWRVVAAQSLTGATAGREGFAVAAADPGWASVFPGFELMEGRLDTLVASLEAAGVHLFTIDSDDWGAAIFTGGQVLARFDSRAPGGGAAMALSQAARPAFGLDLDPAALAALLEAEVVYAEETMDGLARLLGIGSARNQRDYLLRGHAQGLDPAGTLYIALEPPPAPTVASPAARDYNVYLYAMIQRPAPAFGRRLIDLLRWARDRLNGGRWGAVTHATLTPGVRNELKGVTQLSAERFPASVLPDRPQGFSEADLERLVAYIDAGQLQTLAVDLDHLNFNYRRAAPTYHTVQLLFYNLLNDAGQTTYPARYAAVFGPDSELPALVFEGLRAHHGFIGIVPADAEPTSEALTRLVAWPPTGHWLNYLSAALVAAGGGMAALRAALPGFALSPTPSGGLTVQLPIPPEEIDSPAAAALRAAFTTALAMQLGGAQ